MEHSLLYGLVIGSAVGGIGLVGMVVLIARARKRDARCALRALIERSRAAHDMSLDDPERGGRTLALAFEVAGNRDIGTGGTADPEQVVAPEPEGAERSPAPPT